MAVAEANKSKENTSEKSNIGHKRWISLDRLLLGTAVIGFIADFLTLGSFMLQLFTIPNSQSVTEFSPIAQIITAFLWIYSWLVVAWVFGRRYANRKVSKSDEWELLAPFLFLATTIIYMDREWKPIRAPRIDRNYSAFYISILGFSPVFAPLAGVWQALVSQVNTSTEFWMEFANTLGKGILLIFFLAAPIAFAFALLMEVLEGNLQN